MDKTNWRGDEETKIASERNTQCPSVMGRGVGESDPTPRLTRATAPPSHATLMGSSQCFSQLRLQAWRQSAHMCQEGLSVYTGLTVHCQLQHQAPQLVALKPRSSSDEGGPVAAAPNAGKIIVTHFFPPTSKKRDNEVHGNSSSLMIKTGVAMAPLR